MEVEGAAGKPAVFHSGKAEGYFGVQGNRIPLINERHEKNYGAKSIGGERSKEAQYLLNSVPRPTKEEIKEIGVDYRIHEGYKDDWSAYNEEASYAVDIQGVSKETLSLVARLNRWTAKNGALTQDEFCALVDMTGKREPYKEHGTEGGVGYDDEFWDWIQSSQPNTLIFTHNHLNNKTFSLQDLDTALQNKSIHTLIAVGHDGKIYVASRVKHLPKGQSVDDIMTRYEKEGRIAGKLEKLKKLLEDGKIIAGQESRMREELYVREILKDYFGRYVEVNT